MELDMGDGSCGDCHACCVCLSIDSLDKPAKKPCQHLRPNRIEGCRIYKRRPRECRGFACLWMIGYLDDTNRPDKIGMLAHFAKNSVVSDSGERGFGIEINQFRDDAALLDIQSRLVASIECVECRLVKTTYLDGRQRLFSVDPVWIEDLRTKNRGLQLPPGVKRVAIDVDAMGNGMTVKVD